MGAHTVFRRRTALHRSHRARHRNLYAARTERRRSDILYLVALPAVDDKTAVEPLPRPLQVQALVDNHHAAARGSRLCRSGVHHPGIMVAAGHDMLLLDDGIRKRHTRRGSRRILYDGPQRARPGIIRGHTQHILPPVDDFRQGGAHSPRRQPAGSVPLSDKVFVVPDILRPHRPVHRPVPLS